VDFSTRGRGFLYLQGPMMRLSAPVPKAIAIRARVKLGDGREHELSADGASTDSSDGRSGAGALYQKSQSAQRRQVGVPARGDPFGIRPVKAALQSAWVCEVT
jgi:hypothetical protein